MIFLLGCVFIYIFALTKELLQGIGDITERLYLIIYNMESLFNDPLCQRDGLAIEDIVRPEACELPDHKWYVLRASYCRANKAVELISQTGTLAFLPMECRSTVVKGVRHWKKVPSTPSLLFVYGTYERVRSFTHRSSEPGGGIPYVDFAFDHTTKEENGRDRIMTVPFREMQNFIRIVMAAIPESYSVSPQEIHYRPGGMVRVTDGPFKGIIGRVARIHSQQRVVVTIPGVISFASTYIPKAYIEPIE